MSGKFRETAMRCVFCATACACILAVLLICFFLFSNGIPFFGKVSLWEFLTGETWRPSNEIFGILPMILGSVYVTGGALLLGAPLGILTAIYLVRLLSPQAVPGAQARGGAAGGHPFGGLRLLRAYGASCPL